MRPPSSRVLKNRVNIYRKTGGPDVDGGPQYVYPSTPSLANVAASVQYTDTGEELEENDRVSKVNIYQVIFGRCNPALRPRDKIIWIEGNLIHTMYVLANPPSEAGRGSTFIVRCKEYV